MRLDLGLSQEGHTPSHDLERVRSDLGLSREGHTPSHDLKKE